MNDINDDLKLALEKLARIMGTFDLATGHGETLDQLLDSLESELRDVLGYYRKRREWVGLTDKEMEKLSVENDKATFLNDEETDILWFDGDCFALLRAAEAKLREKNT